MLTDRLVWKVGESVTANSLILRWSTRESGSCGKMGRGPKLKHAINTDLSVDVDALEGHARARAACMLVNRLKGKG